MSARRLRQVWYHKLATNRFLVCVALIIFLYFALPPRSVPSQPPQASLGATVAVSFDDFAKQDVDDSVYLKLKYPPKPSLATIELPVNLSRVQDAVAQMGSLDGKCPSHSPGRVLAPDAANRRYCYGASTLPGPRICDVGLPDFTQPLSGSIDWILHTVREQDYLIRPFYHTSLMTARYRANTGADNGVHRDVSLVTQGSWNRLSYLEPLATRWRGPISVALLIDSPEQISELGQTIEDSALLWRHVDIHLVLRQPKYHGPVEGCGTALPASYQKELEHLGVVDEIDSLTVHNGQYLYRCYPTCVGFGHPKADCPKQSVLCSGHDYMGSMEEQAEAVKIAKESEFYRHPSCPIKDNHYPVNMLRNVALQNVVTDLVMVLDIDNVPSACMSQFAKMMEIAEKGMAEGNLDKNSACPGLYAFIPPAIEMSQEALGNMEIRQSGQCVTIDKHEAFKAMHSQAARPMHMYFPPAYVPTNHLDWMRQKEATVYEVFYSIRFEPYYVARKPIPMFSGSFVDRGGNFAQQVMEMHAGGYRFFVLPEVFVIDIPHSSTGPSQTVDNQRMSNALWKAFYDNLPRRYGTAMAPYKGPRYKAMRARLDKMIAEYNQAVQGNQG